MRGAAKQTAVFRLRGLRKNDIFNPIQTRIFYHLKVQGWSQEPVKLAQ